MPTTRLVSTLTEHTTVMGSLIEHLRLVRDGLIFRQHFQSAVFLSDKILALKSSTEDIFVLAKCLYRLKEYQRAAHIITCRNLHRTDTSCCLLVIKCYFKCKKYLEASELAKNMLAKKNILDCKSEMWKIPLYIMQSLLYQALDNQKSAKGSLYNALSLDFACYEAFYMLTHQHMLTKTEEIDLLNIIIANNELILGKNDNSAFLCVFMRFFYYTQLKKYDKPDDMIIYSPFQIFSNNTDVLVALAERHYYNCKYNQALDITTSLLTQDIDNFECLLIHVSCLIEFKKSNDLFTLAQKLLDLYPEKEISWYALGCYYHLIEKVDLARRFLQKSTTLNSFFAPAWLLYGHSFSHESEHDQAISAYFKASHFMPGCHLPLLYIGVEYILTDNCRLGEKFIMKALTIAPDDPLALHELGIIAFHSNEIIKAERHFKNALKILKYDQSSTLPNRYDTLLNNMGHTLRKLGRYTDAIEYHKKALTMSPQNASFYSAIGFIYCLMGKWKEAVEHLDYAHGLYKLLRHEDPHTKNLLENYALKQYSNICRYSLAFSNKFSDKDYVDKLCEQAPKKINLKSKKEQADKSCDMDLDESTFMEDVSDSSIWNNSLRIL